MNEQKKYTEGKSKRMKCMALFDFHSKHRACVNFALILKRYLGALLAAARAPVHTDNNQERGQEHFEERRSTNKGAEGINEIQFAVRFCLIYSSSLSIWLLRNLSMLSTRVLYAQLLLYC